MRKMPCVFTRDFTDKRRPVLLEEVTPGCEWVLEGRGDASVKLDGTACAVIGGRLHARYDAKRGKSAPVGGIPCDPLPDDVTGHWPHWIPVTDAPEFRWHREALAVACADGIPLPDGTYELCGPKVNGNPERFDRHALLAHGAGLVMRGGLVVDAPRTFAGLRDFLRDFLHEGIVFRDGERFAKIRRDDYGYPWPVREPRP